MSYPMLSWLMMSPSISGAYHLAGVKLDGVTASNHQSYQLSSGRYYAMKGGSGYPWDINGIDSPTVAVPKIYLSTTEYGAGRGGGYADPYQAKRFESLDPAIGYRGVPFCLQNMNIGDFVVSPPASSYDSNKSGRCVIYYGTSSSCGGPTPSVFFLGHTKCTLTGPFNVNYDTVSGHASGNLGNIQEIVILYQWGGSDPSSVYSTQEEFHLGISTTSGPWGGAGVFLGLVHWQTENWNSSTNSYDAPNDGDYFNQFTAGWHAAADPCGFGVDFSTPTPPAPPTPPGPSPSPAPSSDLTSVLKPMPPRGSMKFQVKNAQWLKTYEPSGKLAEAIQSVAAGMTTHATQTNGNPSGNVAAPSPVSALSVTAADGIFDFQIQDNSPVARGIFYHIESSLTPDFASPYLIYSGPGRNFRSALGNQTYYFRAYSQYLTSEPSSPVYFGGTAKPAAVAGGGTAAGPTPQPSAGSGTSPTSGLTGLPQGFGFTPVRGPATT